MRYYIISTLVVIALCAYIMYLTYRLYIAEEENLTMKANLCEIRHSIDGFERKYSALYFTHKEFFENLRRYTYNRR